MVFDPIHIILNENNEFGLYINASSIKLIYYTNNYYLIENIKKPLKGISSFSYDELKDICIKINIQTTIDNKKRTKKELYQELQYII